MPIIDSEQFSLADSFTFLELQNPSYRVPELHQICQTPDRGALNCEKVGRVLPSQMFRRKKFLSTKKRLTITMA